MRFTKEVMREKVKVKPTQRQRDFAKQILSDVESALRKIGEGYKSTSVEVNVGDMREGLELAKEEFAKNSDLDWKHVTDSNGHSTVTLSWD